MKFAITPARVLFCAGWFLAGCGDAAPCASGTILFRAAFDEVTRMADQVRVDIRIEAGDNKPNPGVPHTVGAGTIALQINFPNGYPAGKMVTLTVYALKDGVILATKRDTRTLSPGCTEWRLAVGIDDAGQAAADASDGAPDVSGEDAAAADTGVDAGAGAGDSRAE